MSKLVITLFGPGNERVGRINVNLEGIPDGYTILPEAMLVPLDAPQIVTDIYLTAIPS